MEHNIKAPRILLLPTFRIYSFENHASRGRVIWTNYYPYGVCAAQVFW